MKTTTAPVPARSRTDMPVPPKRRGHRVSEANAGRGGGGPRAGHLMAESPSAETLARASVLVPVLFGLFLTVTSLAGEEKPQPVSEAYGNAANDLPLDAYRKLRVLWEASTGLFDFKSPQAADLPAGVKSKDAAQEALAKVAAEQRQKLVAALGASQALHRELAAKLLPKCGDRKVAVEALAGALPREPDTGVRLACVAGLGELKDASGVEALCRMLSDSNEAVRAQAALELGEIRDPRAIDGLLETLLKDDKAGVRRRAALALKEIKDPRSLEGLMKALDAEQDYRVRMAVADAVRAVRGKDAVVAKDLTGDQGEGEDVLGQLSKDMREVEEKLRADRHDQAVQVDQKDIEERLTQLIKKVEEMQQQQQQSQSKQQQQQQQQQQGQQPGQQKQASSPMADSKMGGSAQRGALNPAEVASRQAEWAKLPPAMREEMLQVYREGMPERWRRRLEAYFLSVATEEVQQPKP